MNNHIIIADISPLISLTIIEQLELLPFLNSDRFNQWVKYKNSPKLLKAMIFEDNPRAIA